MESRHILVTPPEILKAHLVLYQKPRGHKLAKKKCAKKKKTDTNHKLTNIFFKQQKEEKKKYTKCFKQKRT